jgi:hypothetical protein
VKDKKAGEERLMARAVMAYASGAYAEARLLAMAAEAHGAAGSARLVGVTTGILDARDPEKARAIRKRVAAITERAAALREFTIAEATVLKELRAARRTGFHLSGRFTS